MKRRLMLFIIFFAFPAWAANRDSDTSQYTSHTYKLSDTDTLKIAQVSLYAYQMGFEITRQSGERVTSIPLRMEELDDHSQLKIVDGVRFAAIDDPSFDPETGRLEFGNKDGYVATYGYEYQLVGDIFKLLKETKSEFVNCNDKTNMCDTKETVIFNARDTNAPSH